MIIDTFNHLRDARSVLFELDILSRSSGYLRTFGIRMVSGLGVGKDRIQRIHQASDHDLWAELEAMVKEFGGGIKDAVAEAEAAGVDIVLIHDEDLGGPASGYSIEDSYWRRILDEGQGRYRILGSIHPSRSAARVEKFKEDVRCGLLCGLFLSPFQQKKSPLDTGFNALYEACIDLDVPVWIHSGMHWDRGETLDYDRPAVFDTLCVRYPELKIIAGHAGWPWVLEMVALAWKHKNLYLELSAHLPKYLNHQGSGWESLFRFGDSAIRDKVVVGTASTLLGESMSEIWRQYQSLPLKDETKQCWFGNNAARIFKFQD